MTYNITTKLIPVVIVGITNPIYIVKHIIAIETEATQSLRKEINYSPIMSEYKKVFDTFMKELNLNCQYKWTIANYTAMKSQQYMRAHDHIGDSDYTCIHYAKFNPKKHSTTTFFNSHQWANSIKYIRPDYYNKLDIRNEKHSYQLPYFQVPTKQDDLLITPSCVTHEVPPFESDELRVTIVINLSIK